MHWKNDCEPTGSARTPRGTTYGQRTARRLLDDSSMVDTYLDYYIAASKTAKMLPYIVPASPGFDDRPWFGSKATVRSDPTPIKFERMLRGAKQYLDSHPGAPQILMIEAWNEYGEGSYVAPTKKWGMSYLEAIRKVFSR